MTAPPPRRDGGTTLAEAAASPPDRAGSVGPPVICARSLCKTYGEGPAAVEALRDVTLEVISGEFVSVMGPSGSGKSTLLHVLGCLHRPTSGTYELEGVRVDELGDAGLSRVRNARVGMIFQQYNLLRSVDIISNVELPLVYAGVPPVVRRERARELLERLGLGAKLAKSPSELSGGQEQRVAIARALVASPAVILADEPTGNLDSASGAEIMALFAELNRAGRTIIQVTHDREKAESASRIVHIADGRIVRVEDLRKPSSAARGGKEGGS
jgi:putative ABC transport system ATP-binding protein